MTEINDVEPVHDFLWKISGQPGNARIEVDLVKTGHLLSDRVVVSKTSLDLFAARLFNEYPDLYREFTEEYFPGADAGTFVGTD